jgi:4-oxalocrotonate tautomerase family enzyme
VNVLFEYKDHQRRFTKKDKEKLIPRVTNLLVNVLNQNSATTIVVIDEVETDNSNILVELVTEIRNRDFLK